MTGIKEQVLALAEAAGVRVIFFLGRTDVGKTTTLLALANALCERNFRVGVVDADLGQSTIGPPTTIGLGLLRQPIQHLGEAEVVGLYFVGAITPAGHLLPTVCGTAALVQKARRLGVEKLLIDTTGLVSGDIGRVLKQQKIELVAPDLICCLQREGECEPILRAYRHGRRPQIVRLTPQRECRVRGQEERRAYREQQFKRYFARAEPRELALPELNLVGSPLFTGRAMEHRQQQELRGTTGVPILWGEVLSAQEMVLVTPYALSPGQVQTLEATLGKRRIRLYPLASLKNTLLALLDEQGDVLGLGIIRYLDFQRERLTVLTPVREPVQGLKFSRFRYPFP